MVFVTIALTPSPITPILRGGFPQNTYRGQVCLLQEKIEGNQENFKKGFLERFPQIVEIIYTLRFVHKVNKFVDGHCPGRKMSSIGKYRRNILGLQSTFWAALCGASFPVVDYFVRFLSQSLNKWEAFYVNFFILDGIVYLFYVSILVVALMEDIPSLKEGPRRIVFYVSKPQKLEPRRCCGAVSNPKAVQTNLIGQTSSWSSNSRNQTDPSIHVTKIPKITKVKESDLKGKAKKTLMKLSDSAQKL